MDINEKIKHPEKEDRRYDWKKESGREAVPEKKENAEDEKIIAQELKRELDLMEADEGAKKEAESKAKKIKFLGEEEKLERLLEIARKHGVVQAIQVAKSMNDPYILDTLHDILAREGYYKNL